MRFKFPDHETALGVAEGLGAPDELDVGADVLGVYLTVCGLDHHPVLAPEIIRICEASGGIQVTDEAGD